MKPVEKKKIKLYYREMILFSHVDLPCMCFFYTGHTYILTYMLYAYYNYFASITVKNEIFNQLQTTFSLKPLHQLCQFYLKHDKIPGSQNCNIVQVE